MAVFKRIEARRSLIPSDDTVGQLQVTSTGAPMFWSPDGSAAALMSLVIGRADRRC